MSSTQVSIVLLVPDYEKFLFLVAWWRMYGGETPGLKDMAMKILSLTTSSSGCEKIVVLLSRLVSKTEFVPMLCQVHIT